MDSTDKEGAQQRLPSEEKKQGTKKSNKKRSIRRTASRERENKKKRFRAMTQQDAALLFPQVLQPIAESRFLSTTDLGRLLLLTSKSMTASALEQKAPREGGNQEPARQNNAVWKCLCFTHWGFDDASALMETMKPLSAEQCFRKLAAVSGTDNTEKFPVPRALQYAQEDYVVIVSVRDRKNDKNMFCKAIPGQDIPEFFDKGEAAIEFDQPLWKKTLDKGQDVLHMDWDSTLRIMRRTDQRVVELGRYYNREESVERSTEKEGLCDAGGGSWISHSCPPVNATYGLALLRHCFGNPYCDSFEVELDLDYRMVTKTAVGKNANDAIGIYGFSLNARCEDRDGNHSDPVSEALEGKDVTFAHFLEAFDLWYSP